MMVMTVKKYGRYKTGRLKTEVVDALAVLSKYEEEKLKGIGFQIDISN